MYLDYWELAAKPFEPQLAGGDFYFPSESHEGALSKLRYAVQQGRGVAALAGPSGAGKTLLIDRLAESIDPETSPLVRVGFPQLSTRELLAYLAEKLQAPAVSANATGAAEESIRRLELLAEQNSEKGRRPVVVIDEAHLLEDSGALETIRLLDNFRSGGEGAGPAFTFLLVGQMGLLSSVARHPALDERLAVKSLLRSLTAEETSDYVRRRVVAAGAERELFSEAALQQLHALSGGSPRRINRLADLALVVGFAPQIEPKQVASVHRELVTLGGE